MSRDSRRKIKSQSIDRYFVLRALSGLEVRGYEPRVRSNTSSRTGIVGGEKSSIAFDW